jgi:hypothetical protein
MHFCHLSLYVQVDGNLETWQHILLLVYPAIRDSGAVQAFKKAPFELFKNVLAVSHKYDMCTLVMECVHYAAAQNVTSWDDGEQPNAWTWIKLAEHYHLLLTGPSLNFVSSLPPGGSELCEIRKTTMARQDDSVLWKLLACTVEARYTDFAAAISVMWPPF